MVGLAVGPTVGGFVLAIAPWQVLLLVNVPIAVLAIVRVRAGIAADEPAELHRDPVDVLGAVLGTATIVLALVSPTLFVDHGAGSWAPWAATAAAVAGAVLFVLRERTAEFPLLDLALLARPLVSSGLAYKAAAGLATAGLGYLGHLATSGWSRQQTAQFEQAVTIAGVTLTVLAGVLVGWALRRARTPDAAGVSEDGAGAPGRPADRPASA